jgi:hypothetical protein
MKNVHESLHDSRADDLWGPYIGFDVCLGVSTFTLMWMQDAWLRAAFPRSLQQQRLACSLLAFSLDTTRLTKLADRLGCSNSEVALVAAVQRGMDAGLFQGNDALCGSVLDAWRHLAQTGLLSASGLLDPAFVSHVGHMHDAGMARAAARAATHGLRACAHATCASREVHVSQFKLCAACKMVVYCSKEHQAANWPAHKAACKAARAAAANGAAGPL